MALPLRRKEKKSAELVNCSNALAWRQPFCTTSGGTDHHTEALALSWHRPDSGLGVVNDSQTGACQAWRLSLLTSVLTISLLPSVACPETLTLGSFLSCTTAPNLPPSLNVPISHCFHICWFEAFICAFRFCKLYSHVWMVASTQHWFLVVICTIFLSYIN